MLVKYQPTSHDIWKDVDKIWDDFFTHGRMHKYYEPVQYDAEHGTLELDVPGVKKEDLKVTIVDDRITVSGKRGKQEFTRMYSVDPNYDASSANAVVEDGVLTVTFDRRPETKPRQIEVKVR